MRNGINEDREEKETTEDSQEEMRRKEHLERCRLTGSRKRRKLREYKEQEMKEELCYCLYDYSSEELTHKFLSFTDVGGGGGVFFAQSSHHLQFVPVRKTVSLQTHMHS